MIEPKKKSRFKKLIAYVLVTAMILSILPFVVSAATVSVKSKDEAVSWLNSQDGATYDFDGIYGTQCVEFVKAYVNWLVTGNAWNDCWNRPTGNGNTIWQNSLWEELGWEVYYNTSDFLPQPGDIFSAGTNNGNHTGVVISSDINTAIIADANARNSDWRDGDPVYIHTINWRSASSDSAYGATHFIRPKFVDSFSPHTCNMDIYMWYEAVHPHPNDYKCSICGKIQRDKSSSNYISTCTECNRPSKPQFVGIKSEYSEIDDIKIQWTDTLNTTHNNFWLYYKDSDGNWQTAEHTFYATNPLVRKLAPGEYRMFVQSYNSNMWESDRSDWLRCDSDYVYFKVNESIREPAENPFTDVPSNEWFSTPVMWAVENGITNGTSPTTFSPEDTCTRGQIVTFLWRAAGSPEPTSQNNVFTDVKADDYYYKAVLWAVENGITNGTTKTTFDPDGSCTRSQAVTFLWRYEDEEQINADNIFTDVPVYEYYTNAVLWAVENKITNGTTNTTFEPNTFCTRGHIVTFLYRDIAE